MELLFESRSNIITIWGKLFFRQEKAEVLPEPVLVGDTASDGSGVSIYGSVLRDGGMYRMWYQSWPKVFDGSDTTLVGYAESDDGLSWRKPKLGIVDLGGTDNNLCNLGMHCPSVFIDPTAPPSHRYRATGYTNDTNVYTLPGTRTVGYFAAHSADGLRWELDAPMPCWPYMDVITSIYHPGQKRGIVSFKRGHRMANIARRSIWQASLRDGVWQSPHCALVPDDFDDIAARAHGYQSADYYGMAMQPVGQGTAGFIWQFRHQLPYTGAAHGSLFGTTDMSLAFQESEGSRWLHAPGRPDFLSHDATWWTHGGIYSASSPVEVGDEHWLFICGARHSHGWTTDANWKDIPDLVQKCSDEGMMRVGVARWPKHRLFGFTSDPQGGLWLDFGEITEPCELVLNYATFPDGDIRVKLSSLVMLYAEDEIPGRGYDECMPLTGNQLAQTVAWKDGAVIHPVPGRRLTAYIEMNRATLYAYELRPLKG